MFWQRAQGFGQWQPLPHPTPGRRIAATGTARSGYIVEKWWHPGRSLTEDGDRGLLQDGEGWTPRRMHQPERQRPPDLLPAAKVGAARARQPVREHTHGADGGGGGGGGEGVRARR